MKIPKTQSWMILCAVVVPLLAGQAARAQQANVQARVVEAVDDTRTVQLKGNVHPLARAEFDQGALPDSQPLTRMLLLLQRSDAQEASLRQLMDAQQTKGSSSYHAWLTPEQFGKQYGPADADVQAVTDWLTRQGFQVAKVSAGRTVIEFSGNVAQVRNAFHTEIHKYAVKGEEHFANASDPAIPAALAPVVKGVVALHNFPIHAQHRRVGSFQRNLATGEVKPLFTYTDLNGTFFGVGPADFAKIYNIPAGADGSGQSIAVVGQSNINIQDVRDFRSMFGLPAKDPKIIVNGPDPGLQLTSGDEEESDLDVEWAGAVAPAAQILFVTSQSTQSSLTQVAGGVDLSALYIIDNNLAPVMSESYGECEPFVLTAGNAFYNALWQQAAAEGITVVVAAGDSGSAGCDSSFTENAATNGLAVSGTASTPYNVAVGGTDFDQFNNLSNYWSSTNNASTQLSALGYIAEVPWDDSLCAANYPAACTSVNSTGGDLSAGSGGPSGCVLATSGTNGNITCNTSAAFPNKGYPKPAFQNGVTPSDALRDLPDISLFASDGFNSSFYIICESDANPSGAPCDLSTSPTFGTHNFTGVGGTSGGTPSFAGIIALVNQQTGERQGNANFVLYALATKENYSLCNSSSFTNPATPAPATCVFYDITKGNNSVACTGGSLNCSQPSGFGLIVSGVAADHGSPAFQAVAGTATQSGYDLATGLGSINVKNLLNNWGSATRTATTTTLGTPNPASLTSGQSFSIPVAVTSTSGTPSGDVSLIATTATGQAAFGPFTLVGGTVTASTKLLPPGTTSIVAYYSGDVTHGASTSAPLALAVSGANQVSKTLLSFVTFDSNGNPVLSTSSQSVSYGSPYILQIAVTNASGTSCLTGGSTTTPATPCPTGTVALTDNSTGLNDWPIAGTLNATNIAKLNNQGIAEDQPIQLPGGSHSLVAQFTSGDTNFQGSTSNMLSVTITKATTQTLVGGPSPVTAGTTVTLTAQVQTNSNGAGPTGMVSFTNGSASLGSANCVPTAAAISASGTLTPAFCTATLSTAISGLYPPPVGEPRGPGLPVVPLIVALASLLLFALGWRWMPERRRRAFAVVSLMAFVALAGAIAGCGGGSGGGGGGGGTSRTISASYPGDTNYSASSGSVSITVQ
jgi:hypothetical protein